MKVPVENKSRPAHIMRLPQSSAAPASRAGLFYLQGAGAISARQEMEFALSLQPFFTGSGLWKIGIFYQVCILK